MIVAANGRMGWSGDDKYLLRSIDVQGTFTPTGGTPQEFEFSKTYGAGPKGETVECIATFTDEPVPGGTITETIEISAVQI